MYHDTNNLTLLLKKQLRLGDVVEYTWNTDNAFRMQGICLVINDKEFIDIIAEDELMDSLSFASIDTKSFVPSRVLFNIDIKSEDSARYKDGNHGKHHKIITEKLKDKFPELQV